MNEWTIKRIAVVAGLSALAVTAALAVDQGASADGPSAVTAAGFAAARVTTSTTSYSFAASPTIHAVEGGKCVKSSPHC